MHWQTKEKERKSALSSFKLRGTAELSENFLLDHRCKHFHSHSLSVVQNTDYCHFKCIRKAWGDWLSLTWYTVCVLCLSLRFCFCLHFLISIANILKAQVSVFFLFFSFFFFIFPSFFSPLPLLEPVFSPQTPKKCLPGTNFHCAYLHHALFPCSLTAAVQSKHRHVSYPTISPHVSQL